MKGFETYAGTSSLPIILLTGLTGLVILLASQDF
jgi:hypothetical protein